MIRTLFVVCTILLFTINNCIAQSKLDGYISDTKKDLVAYTTVTLAEESVSAEKVIQADSVGHFVFKNIQDGNYTLSVYSLGYTKSTFPVHISEDTIFQIVLKPLEGVLNEVTVTGNKPVIERKPDRVIFNVANSINAAGSNGLEVLKKAPGIRINDKTVSLAGRGNLGIMIDGRLLHLSDKALMNYLKSFSSAQISRIEIITHPSAQYDAEGNAGLVNIITKKSDKSGLSGNLEVSVKRFFYKDQPNYKGIQNYGDVDGSAGLNYNSGKWSVYSNLSYSAGGELWGYGIDVYYPEKHWAMKDTGEYRIATVNVLAGTDYKLSTHTTLGFEYNYVYHIEDGADYVRVPVYNKGGRLDSSLKTYATYYPIAKSNAFNLHLIQELNDSGALLTLNVDYFNSYRNDKSDLVTRSYTGEGKLIAGNTRRLYDTTVQNIRIYTFKADIELPTPFAQFSLGSKLSFIDNYSNIYYYNKKDGELILDRRLSNEFRYIENTQALYTNAIKDMRRWKLDGGLRAEFTQTKAISYFEEHELKKHYVKLFPSLSISYKSDDKNNFSLNYNKRIHRPTFWNLNPFKSFMSAYTYVEGNPYLEPEYVTNIQLSHQYKRRLVSSLFMNVTNNGFAQVIKTHENGQYIHTTTMLNFIKSYRYGLSESLSFHPFHWLESSGQVSGYYTKVNSNLSYINGIDGLGWYVETNHTFYLNRDKTVSGFLGFWYQFPEVDHFGKSNAYYNADLGLQALSIQKKLSVSLNFSDVFQSSASKVYTVVDQIRNTYTDFQLNSQIRLSAAWHFGNENHKRKPTNTGNEAERSRIN